MRIFVPKELHPTDKRVPLLPSGVAKLTGLGAEVEIEPGLGAVLNWPDSVVVLDVKGENYDITAGYRADSVTFATLLAQSGDRSVAFV